MSALDDINPDRKLRLARVRLSSGKRIWVIFNAYRTLPGKPGESKQALLFRWNYPRGADVVEIEWTAPMSEAELKVHVESARRQAVKEDS